MRRDEADLCDMHRVIGFIESRGGSGLDAQAWDVEATTVEGEDNWLIRSDE